MAIQRSCQPSKLNNSQLLVEDQLAHLVLDQHRCLIHKVIQDNIRILIHNLFLEDLRCPTERLSQDIVKYQCHRKLTLKSPRLIGMVRVMLDVDMSPHHLDHHIRSHRS